MWDQITYTQYNHWICLEKYSLSDFSFARVRLQGMGWGYGHGWGEGQGWLAFRHAVVMAGFQLFCARAGDCLRSLGQQEETGGAGPQLFSRYVSCYAELTHAHFPPHKTWVFQLALSPQQAPTLQISDTWLCHQAGVVPMALLIGHNIVYIWPGEPSDQHAHWWAVAFIPLVRQVV